MNNAKMRQYILSSGQRSGQCQHDIDRPDTTVEIGAEYGYCVKCFDRWQLPRTELRTNE